MFRAEGDPEAIHGGPHHGLGLSGQQFDLAGGTTSAVVELVEQLGSDRHWFREPYGDGAAGGSSRDGMAIEYLTDLFVAVQAVDQCDGRGSSGSPATAGPDRYAVGVRGPQDHVAVGVQLGSDILDAPFGFDVEFTGSLDRSLGAGRPAPRGGEAAVMGGNRTAPQLGPDLAGRHSQFFCDHSARPAVVLVVPHGQLGLVWRQRLHRAAAVGTGGSNRGRLAGRVDAHSLAT